MDAIIMRPTESSRNPVLIIACGLINFWPASTAFFIFSSSTSRALTRSAAVITQLLDSTLPIVRTPRMIGSVIVRSGCARVVRVQKDSESNGVGSMDIRPNAMVMTTKTGSWTSGGITIEGNGWHLYSLKSSLRLCVSYTKDESIHKAKIILSHNGNRSLRVRLP